MIMEMTREEAYNRIDAIIAKNEIDDDYVTITSVLDYDALRIARKALEQEPCDDCRNCKKWDDCECGRKGNINGTSIGYSIGECKDYEPCENAISREELLKAIDTLDKFGYSARYGLERLDKDDKDFVPYVKYDDVIKCIKGMGSRK